MNKIVEELAVNKLKFTKLSDELINKLNSKPETGMGYKIAKINLKNGQTINNVIVINGMFIDILIDINLISNIWVQGE